MKDLKEFKPIFKLLAEDKWKFIIASLVILITSLTEILTGYLNGAAVESITKNNLKSAIIFLSIYFIISCFIEGAIYLSARSKLLEIESKITRKLEFSAYKKSIDLPSYAYEKTSSGEIINRITHDADTLSFTFLQILEMTTSMIGTIILMFYIFFNSIIIGLEIMIIVGILFLVLKKYNPILKDIHVERKQEQDKFTSLVTESVRGVREIKTLGIKNNLIHDMKDIIKLLFNKSKKEIDVKRKFNILTRFLKVSLECIVFITCTILLYYKNISLTFFIAMTYYIYRYMWLIESINDFTQTYQQVLVSVSRVNEILENRLYEDEIFGNKVIRNSKGVVEFKNVTFGYPEEDIILDDFNLKLEPNIKIAIEGKSGQGKSTLFNLLTRVFDPTEGEILLDGINIKDLTESNLRKNISIIRQEPFVFNRTIKENFKLLDDKITLSTIRKYTKMAYLDDYIMSLPKKYNTVLGEGGINLSGGQKQRLAIARTLARESKVILFDEATSALDNSSQNYIKKAIDNLVKDHTVVIVAHRLSTIIDADVIYVVDDGKIVASGKHDELLKKSKIYRNLYDNESFN